jgi:hypothetical protein
LFDPTTLSFGLVEQVQKAYRQIRPGEHRWDDPSFQNYAYRTARLAVDTAKTLAEITSKEGQLSGEPFVTLCSQLLFLLGRYELEKKRIPTESRWYARRYVHPDWYQTEDYKTSLAYRSSGRLDPKEVSDVEWLESAILPITYLCIRKNAEANRYDLVSRVANQIKNYARSLASEHQAKSAVDVVDKLTASCSDLIFAPKLLGPDPEPIEQLALADSVASIAIEILLAYTEAVRVAERRGIASAIEKIRWSAKDEIYSVGLPRHIIPQVEWMYPRIEFELRTEGFKTSPNWYLSELAIRSHLENLKTNLEALAQVGQTLFDRWIGAAEGATLSFVRANLLTREAEYWHKLEYQFHVFRQQSDGLNADRRIEGLSWPTIDLDAFEKQVKDRKKVLLKRMAKDVTTLSLIRRPEEYPDFAGQFLHTVGESLITALIENDSDLVEQVFPLFFFSSFLQYDRLGTNVSQQNWQATIAIKVAVAPMLDLMDLSGYGFLLADFHDNPIISSTIADTWNKFIDARKVDGKDILAFLGAAVAITETSFEIAHRGLIRTQWIQEIANVLRGLPRQPLPSRGAFIESRTVAVHKSPLVRVMAGDQFFPMYSGIDIFISQLVRKRTDGTDINFGSRRNFSDVLAREVKREESNGDAEPSESDDDE